MAKYQDMIERNIRAAEAATDALGDELEAIMGKVDGEYKKAVATIKTVDGPDGTIATAGDAGLANVAAADAAFVKGEAVIAEALAKMTAKGGYIDRAINASFDLGLETFRTEQKFWGAAFSIDNDPVLAIISRKRLGNYVGEMTTDGAREIRRGVWDAIRGDISSAELPGYIRDKMAAEGIGMPLGRAKTIARSETFAAYRESKNQQYTANGYEYFEYAGPLDGKTTDICAPKVGQVRTREGWNEVDPSGMIWIYGLHYNCRHDLIGVKPEWSADIKERIVQ